jgi:hypothetical protein
MIYLTASTAAHLYTLLRPALTTAPAVGRSLTTLSPTPGIGWLSTLLLQHLMSEACQH